MGVMHIGDPHTQKKTEVKLSMDVETVEAIGNRELIEWMRNLRQQSHHSQRSLRGGDDDQKDDQKDFSLEQKDMDAIGTVTAEVIATTLQPKLKSYGIELEGVLHKNVAINLAVVKNDGGNQEEQDQDQEQEQNQEQQQQNQEQQKQGRQRQLAPNNANTVDQLVVDLEVRGHYQPPPHLDFDYIVEQSINSEQFNIRRELVHYNQNCENQRNTVSTLKLSQYDFKEINSWRGTRPNRAKGDNGSLDMDIDTSTFRMACAQGIDIPPYLDPATADIALNVDAVVEEVVQVTTAPVAVDKSRPFPWITVTAVSIAGLLLLALLWIAYKRGGALVRKKHQKTVDGHEHGNTAVVIQPDDGDIFPESYADDWDEGKGTGDAKADGKITRETVVDDHVVVRDKDIICGNGVPADADRKSSASLFGALTETIRRELSNIQAALRSERGPSHHHVVPPSQTHSNTAASALDGTFTDRTDKTLSTAHTAHNNSNHSNSNHLLYANDDALPSDPTTLDKVLEEGSTLSRVHSTTEGDHIAPQDQPHVHEGYERKRSQGSSSGKKKSRRKSQESERSGTNSDPFTEGNENDDHVDDKVEARVAAAVSKTKYKKRSQDLDASERSGISSDDKLSYKNDNSNNHNRRRRRRRSSQEELDQSDQSAFSESLDESNTSRLSSSNHKIKSGRRTSNDLGKSEPTSCCVTDDDASSPRGKPSRRRTSDLDKLECSSESNDGPMIISSRYHSKDNEKLKKPKRRSRQLHHLEEPVVNDESSDGQGDGKSAESISATNGKTKNNNKKKKNVEMKRRSTANESVSS
ncbi:hypothetical protein ACHAXS_005212 [Conticribra weissflogii]